MISSSDLLTPALSQGQLPVVPTVSAAPNEQSETLSNRRAHELGKEFEGVFLSMLVKEMRNTLEGDGLFGGESSDTYGGMFDMFLGESLSEASPLGIADMMVEEFRQKQLNAKAISQDNIEKFKQTQTNSTREESGTNGVSFTA